MPLELGLFLGARKFGGRAHSRKKALILDSEPYRYHAFISDIAGQDIHAHGGEIERLIAEVATWLRDEAQDPDVPGGRAIVVEYGRFCEDLPAIAAVKRLETDELDLQGPDCDCSSMDRRGECASGCALRAVSSTDGMTADYYPFPHEILGRAATRITNEVRGINRVVYDITSTPRTIEWE
jgi:hypothetical protein